MKQKKTEHDEAELLNSIESGAWKSVESLESEIIKHQKIAADTLRKIKYHTLYIIRTTQCH